MKTQCISSRNSITSGGVPTSARSEPRRLAEVLESSTCLYHSTLLRTKVRAPALVALVGLMCLFGFGFSTFAADPTNTAPSANRYLLVIETSRSMERRADGTLKAVEQLLSSTMSGQLRRGDTIGLWTFNQQVYGGRFPLQEWFPETHRAIYTRVLTFVQNLKYEKEAHLELLMPALDRLIKTSPFLTIILVSDGEQYIHGTDFDKKINDIYQGWLVQQRKAHMPFLTVLRAHHGKLTDFAVNAAPWPVEMPPLPKELLEPMVAKKPPPPPAKPAPLMGQPLIVSGRKAEQQAPSAVTNAADAGAIAAQPQAAGQVTNTVGSPSRPASNESGVRDSAAASLLVETAKSSSSSTPSPALTPTVASTEIPREPARPATPQPVPQTSASDPGQVSPQGSKAEVAQSGRLAAPLAATPSSATTDNAPGSREASEKNATSASANSTADDNSKPGPGNALTAPKPSVAIVPSAFPSRNLFWIAVGFVLAAILMLIIKLLRARAVRHASLITRSLEREKT